MSQTTFIHLALRVSDVERSIAFYARYASMKVTHRRHDRGGGQTAWMNDGKRPFVLVLVEPGERSFFTTILRSAAQIISSYVSRPAHLGVPCSSREEVELLCRHARNENCLLVPPNDAGPVVGFYAMLQDPDGYNLELSHGQEIGMNEDELDRDDAPRAR